MDPLAFGKWDAKRQFEAVSGLVKGFDFAAHDVARKKDFDERTDWNRKHKENEAAAGRLVVPGGPKPDAVVIADVVAELQNGQTHNSAVERAAVKRRSDGDRATALFDEAEKLRARAASLEKEAEEIEAALDALPPLEKPVDLKPIQDQISNAERINAARRAHEQREAFEQAARDAKDKSDALTAKIEARDAAKTAAIAATEMPVPGLDLTDGRVMLNGLPFSEAGTAERIRAGMAIGMALNPKLKIILVDEGSELTKSSFELVAQLAEERGYQVWATTCHHDSGLPEIEIVDGEVAQ